MSVRTRECRSCGATVVWMVTGRGRNIPVDADSVDEAELEFDEVTGLPLFHYGEHQSHFETCPDAKDWRRRE
jgi:hypothetical protein